jgi:magnesium transporter
VIQVLIYDKNTKEMHKEPHRKPLPHEVGWIHLFAPEEAELETVLGDYFQCHPLLIEDCIKMNQRPKLDRYRNYILITFNSMSKALKFGEFDIVIGSGFVVTVSREEQPFIEELKLELLQVEGRMQHEGDVLYELLDRCVDEYVDSVNHIEDQLDRFERNLLRNPNIKIAQEIYQHKRAIHRVRRVLADERSVLAAISHESFPYTRAETDVYFVDIHDHISQVIDSIDSTRESLNGLLELQVNLKSDRMNEIMKTLTIISSIFLPLTFLVGVYGMNFEWMPELTWKPAYPILLVIMLGISVSLWYFYKRKKWI